MLLSGRLEVLTVWRSAIEGRPASLRLRITDGGGGSAEATITPRGVADDSAWGPLAGLPVVTPSTKADQGHVWVALRLLAARQAAGRPGIVLEWRQQLGWHRTDDGAWVRLYLDGTLTAAGLERPGRLRIDRRETDLAAGYWNQRLPALAPGSPDPTLALEALRLLLEWFGAEMPDVAPALLGAVARVTARPFPGDREPGSLRWQFEVQAPSGLGKTALLNAVLRLFCGATYEHDSGTELAEKTEGTPGDTAAGQLGRRAQLTFFAYQDYDHNRGPEAGAAYERQQQHRLAVLRATGNREGGGAKSSRDGVNQERARPAGLELRTFEHDPHAYSIRMGAKSDDARALTFSPPEETRRPGYDWPDYVTRCSGPLFDGLAPTLDALHVAWGRWQAGLDELGWTAAIRDAEGAADEILERCWAADKRAANIVLAPPRVRGQLRDVLTGLGLYCRFLRAWELDAAAELLEGMADRLVRGRLDATLELFGRHEASTTSAARDHVIDGLDALRSVLEAERARLDPARFEGERTLRVLEPGDDERRSRPRVRVGYDALELGQDGEQLRRWWVLVPDTAFDELRAQYRRTHGHDFPLDRSEWMRGLEARGKLALTDRGTDRSRATARMRVKALTDGGRGPQRDYLVIGRQGSIGQPPERDSRDSADSRAPDQGEHHLNRESRDEGAGTPGTPESVPLFPAESRESRTTLAADSGNGPAIPALSSSDEAWSPGSPGSPSSSSPYRSPSRVGTAFRDVSEWQAQWRQPAEPKPAAQGTQEPPGAPESPEHTTGDAEPQRPAAAPQSPGIALARCERHGTALAEYTHAPGQHYCPDCQRERLDLPPAPPPPTRAAPRAGRLLALDSGGLWSPEGAAIPGWLPSSALELLEVAAELGAAEVWVHPSAARALSLQLAPDQRSAGPAPFLEPALADWKAWPTTPLPGFEPAGLAPWLVCKPRGKGDREEITIALVAGVSDHPLSAFAELADGPAILRAVELLHERLGVPFRSSPSATARALLEAGRGLQAGEAAPPQIAWPREEGRFGWTRPLTDAEATRPYVQVFDLNGQDLGTAVSLELGTGTPEHRTGPLAFDRRLPGYWLAALPECLDPMLPDPFAGRLTGGAGEAEAPRWVTTPTLGLAAELGFQVEPLEAWVWPEHRRHLRPAAERLRDARAACKADGSPASGAVLEVVKLAYTKLLGRLESTEQGYGGELLRPDWTAQVVAQSAANLYRKLERVRWAPFAVNVDAAWFAASSADPAQVAAELGLPLDPSGRQLGRFKPAGTAPMEALAGLDLAGGRETMALHRALEERWLR